MATFTGLLSIIGRQSNLDDGAKDWLLLMAGISDPARATFAATQFLVKAKKLHSGQMISVQGRSGPPIGTVSIISMTDASAAGPEAVFNESFALSASVAPARVGAGKKGSKKKKLGRSQSDTKQSRNQSPGKKRK